MKCQEIELLETTVGDTLNKWSAVLWQKNGKPASLTGKTVLFALDDEDGNDVREATETGVEIEPSVSVSVDYTTGRITDNGHDLRADYELLFSGSPLPTGLTSGVRYFPVLIRENDFRLSLTKNGSPITLSSNGTSVTYKVLGSVDYQPQDEDVDEGGTFFGWFIVEQGGRKAHCPANGKRLKIVIHDANGEDEES